MTHAHEVSRSLAGDPIVLPATVTTARHLTEALGIPPAGSPGVLPLVPGIALVHGMTHSERGPTVRWARLPHPLRLLPGGDPIAEVIALTFSAGDSAAALRVASRLRALLDDPAVRSRACSAADRESLVLALASPGPEGGEALLAPDETLALLGSGRAGLDASEVVRRRGTTGENRIERSSRRPAVVRLLQQFGSRLAILLWAGGALAFVAGMPQLGEAVFVVILVNGLFSFLQEHRAERAVEALARLLPPAITVVRGGREARVPCVDLVPGDLLRLEEGDRIPADGRVLDAEGLEVDQGALTGESWPVAKVATSRADPGRSAPEDQPALVFAGTAVVGGSGSCVVTSTGMATTIGRIARLTQGIAEGPSPLQREMAHVTRVVTALAITLGALFLILGTATGMLTPSQGFLFAVGVIVANVPEGLLPTLTLALAIGAQRMARRRSILRKLSSAETLGSTTVICTDKTGTLTENRMSARHVWLAGATRDVSDLAGDAARELFTAAALASRATLERGDPTERALLAAGAVAGIDPGAARRARRLVRAFPFDSYRKRATHVWEGAEGRVASVKGAPRETIALCDRIRLEDRTAPLDAAMRRDLLAEHDRLAAGGLRLLAVASRPLPGSIDDAGAADVERNLTLLGLVALWDPPRAEVPDAIALCRRAGIRVVMVTGDYGLTASAIAARIGLAVRKVVTGVELDALPADGLRELVAEPDVVFARVSPGHKLQIVRQLQARGEVVAVTGDGVNDAPALRAADIGVAMGLRGSEVAREAATMVITDDNFASIVSAVRRGRAIYANMGKFVTYIFASNVPELVPFLAFVLLDIPLPLTVMQILAVDLGTDLLPALALGAEPPEPGVMDRPPRPRGQRLLGAGRLLRAYAFLGLAEAALAMLAFFWTYWQDGWRPGLTLAADGDLYRRATTMTLAAIVAAQVGNVFACRTDRESVFRTGFLSNRLVLIGVAAEIALLVVLIVTPPLARIFGLAPLAFAEWRLLLFFPAVMIGLEEGRKAVVRRARPTPFTHRPRAALAGPRPTAPPASPPAGPSPRPARG